MLKFTQVSVSLSATAKRKSSLLFLPKVKHVSGMVTAYSTLVPAGNIYKKFGLSFVCEGEILLLYFQK